jgi:hypothetical protein
MISGGYYLARRSATVSASGCRSVFFPDAWAIEWTSVGDEERSRRATEFGVGSDAFAWATGAFEKEFGWPNVFYTLTAARAAQGSMVPDSILFGLGLPPSHVDEFLKAAAPPRPQPGYAPVGETGIFQCVRAAECIAPGGEPLGFELLATDFGLLTCSWACNGLETTCAESLGVGTNTHGFVANYADALRCAQLIAQPDTGAEPGLWLPWLLTVYPTK